MKALDFGRARRVTVPIPIIIHTVRSDILAPGRLRELPDLREVDAALDGIGRMCRERTAGRWRTGVVDRPIDDLARTGPLANIFRRDYVLVIG